jgi:hypothetical protein
VSVLEASVLVRVEGRLYICTNRSRSHSHVDRKICKFITACERLGSRRKNRKNNRICFLELMKRKSINHTFIKILLLS